MLLYSVYCDPNNTLCQDRRAAILSDSQTQFFKDVRADWQMPQTLTNNGSHAASQVSSWSELARGVLAGKALTTEQALSVLRCPDEQLLALLDATYTVRRHHFGNTVQLYFLMNAKSGLCPEDCHYCSQ